jgi:hypothetical protein
MSHARFTSLAVLAVLALVIATGCKDESKDLVTVAGPKVSTEHAHAKKGQTIGFQATDASYDLIFNAPTAPDTNPWPFVEKPDAMDGSAAVLKLDAGAAKRTFTLRPDALSGGDGNGYGYTVVLRSEGKKPTPEVVPDP